MTIDKYKDILLKILKFYQKNYYNDKFTYYDIINFIEKELKITDEEIYLGILQDMFNLKLIQNGFSFKYGLHGEVYISKSPRRPKITVLGLQYIKDNNIFQKLLKTSKPIMEIANLIKPLL